jgi:glycosyltransferase involved in cell wall biosynthesis
VSDYSRIVARGLAAAGDEVRVYAPPRRGRVEPDDPGISVRRLPGWFGPRSLVLLERLLGKRPRPDRILVQYVPHAFGFKAMNLPFALWVATRLRRVAPVWAMFHEVAFPFRWRPVTHALLGAATRRMAHLVAGAADRVFVSVPAWGHLLKRVCPRAKSAEWLPVPCNVATDADPVAVHAVRARFATAGEYLLGHFGTFGTPVTELLDPASAEVLRLVPDAALLLFGRGSCEFRARFVAAHPALTARVHAAGELSPVAVAAHLRACDLLLQPFPDGVTSRRGSTMAGLANAVAVATNLGPLTEAVWAGGGVAVAPTPNPTALANLAAALLVDPGTRAEFARRGNSLYRNTFALEHTIARLQGTM